MNRSLRRELLREIRTSRSRFLSILVMVALGVLFLVGLRSSGPDMRNTADQYFDGAGLFDVQILSTLGLTEDDIEAFAQVDGVEAAEGAWSIDASASAAESQKVVKAESLSSCGFNEPEVLEGRLPETAEECAADAALAEAMGLSVGDRIVLEPAESYADALSAQEYTVTAIVNSPVYLSLDRGTSTLGDGSVAGFLLLPEESFLLDYYTSAYIRAEGAAELDAYGSDYQDLLEDLTARLETAAEDRADLRYRTLVSDAQEAVDSGQAELDAAQAEVDDARGELADAQAELQEAQAEADRELAGAQQELLDARAELDDGWAALEEGRQEYEDGTAEGQAELDEARAELDDGWVSLQEARDTLEAAQAEYDSGRASAVSQLNAARQQLEDGEAAYAAGQAEYAASEEQAAALRLQTEQYAAALAAQQAASETAQTGESEEESAAEETAESAEPAEEGPYNARTLAVLELALLQAEEALQEGQEELDEARAELDAGWAAYNAESAAAWAELDAAQAELESGWRDYYDAEETLTQGEADYAQGLSEFEAQTAEAAQALADAEETLTQGEADYQDGVQALEDAGADAERELADAQAEIDGAGAELLDAQAEIDDGQAELDAAQAEIDAIAEPDVYVLDRSANYGFVSYDQNASRMESLATLFPLIFFIVAALVCLTTMTRMVEEERTQIGAVKALGYGTGAIAAIYLVYGILAALGGSIVGIAVGSTVLPLVIFTSYSIMYNLPHLQISLYVGLSLGSMAAGIACTVLATLWAMLATARRTPAELMRPRTPRAGKRVFLEYIGPLWRRFRFSVKVSARNLLLYKKRFWMTVIGVAGCTALMISGLGLRTGIFTVIDIQYGDIFHYTVRATLEDGSPETRDEMEQLLDTDGSVQSYAAADTRTVLFPYSDGSVDGYLTVTDDPDALCTQIALRDLSGEPLEIPEDGVIIDEKLAELVGVSVGDEITIDCGSYITATVAAINEHYAYHYAYMSSGLYESLTGEDFEAKEYLITTEDDADETVSRLCETMMQQEYVVSATNLLAAASSFRSSMEAVNAAVIIIILSAAALALVVLYNLTNINITERVRELATIKVLGFYDMEVAMYIYRENIVLTVLGIALGQIIGKFLCTYLVRTIEMEIVMFGRQARLQNYVMSIVLSLIFALIVNVLMYFRMKRIDMVQSLKSVE